jgi:hypothetical protein
MKFHFPHPHQKRLISVRSADLRVLLTAAPILVGLGVVLYVRRKQLAARQRESRATIKLDEISVSETPLPIGEAVGEPQIQSDAPVAFAPTSALPSPIASERIASAEAQEKPDRVHELKIPTLIPPLTKFPSSEPNLSTANRPVSDTLPRRSQSSRGRAPRRVAAAALSFLVAAAVVYGTVGAVRSHEKKTGPLLFSDAPPSTQPEAPAEGPRLESPPSSVPRTASPDQAASPGVSEQPGAASAESTPVAAASPDPAENTIPAPQHQRKKARHSHSSQHPGTAKRTSKTPAPWKVSF